MSVKYRSPSSDAVCRCSAGDKPRKTELEKTIRRKAKEIEKQVDELGLDWLEEKLQDAVEQPLRPERQFRFGQLLTEALPQARTATIYSVQLNLGGS